MNTWIKRSLGTAAVAGGLLLGGAAIASADEGSSAQQDAFGSSVSSPVSLGGVDLGLSSSSSSSSSTTETRTDRDGSSSSTTRESSDSRADSVGISTGRITADPAGTVTGATRSTTSSDGDDRVSSSSSQAGTVSGKAPISVGGLAVTGTSEQRSADKASTTRTSRDGDTRSTESASTSASKTGYGLAVGELTADPAGTLSGARSDALTRDDEDVTSTSTSSASGAFSSPVSFDGVAGGFTDERSSTDARRETVTDDDGTRSESTRRANASRTTGAFDTGSFTADPAGAFSTTRTDLFDSRDGFEDTANRSNSDSAFDLSAPYATSGGFGTLTREDASATERQSRVSDEDGTVTRTQRDANASRYAPTFGFDGSHGDLLGSFDGGTLSEGVFQDR